MATKTKQTGKPAAPERGERGEPTKRGTAAGFRAGARTRTEAKEMTSSEGKQTAKQQSMQGGPGKAGTKSGITRTHSQTKATTGRGRKARAGA